jgi:CzcA family heavy metal efflux pump
MNLAKFVSEQSRAVAVLVILLCAAGFYAAWQLPTAIFPNTNFPRIVITVNNGEAAAEQTLASVTRPIEEAMNGVPGIRRIKSTTGRGAADVSLFFDWGTDIEQTLQIVQARVSQLRLPPTAQINRVERLTFAVFPVVGYSLTSDVRSPAELRDIAQYTIRPRLSRLAGVSEVRVQGGDVREYHVIVDAEKLNARKVSLTQIADAVRNANLIQSPGLIEENHNLELALVSGQAAAPDELNKIIVAVVNNTPVRLSDVATIAEGKEPNFTIVTADGKRAVLLGINRQPLANTVTVTDEVKRELAAIEKTLPKDIKIAPYYDQSLLVRDSINSVRDAILIGLLLSVVILYAFLRNIGTTFVAILVIPVTILATFLAMWIVGLSFNLMTLGGAAAAIGLVIDDAIVVVENIYTHLSHNSNRRQAVQAAVSEIFVPIIGSTVTPVVVFLPLTILTGVTGVFFRSLALTMAVALLTSLVLALTFTPVLAEKFVKVKPQKPAEIGDDAPTAVRKAEEEHGRILTAIIIFYERILNFALNSRLAVAAVAIVVFALSYGLYQNTGSEFLPSFDEGAFVLDYKAPPGASLAETDHMLQDVEAKIKALPEVESYSRRTGLQLGLVGVTEPNTGDFAVKMKRERSRSTEQVINDLREQIQQSQPALEVEFVGILSDLIGDLSSSPEPIEIKIFSEDKDALRETADKIQQSIKKVPGVVDTFNGVVVSGAAVTFKIDMEQAARFGATTQDIANAVTTALTGDAASTILQQNKLITVRVLMPKSETATLDALKNLQIRSSGTGQQFRLGQAAQIVYDKGQTEIQRESLRRFVAVTGRISGADLGTTIAAIKRRLAKEIKLPAGMTIEYGGLYAEQQASFRELAIALVLAIVLVFLVLLVEFRSFAHPIAIVTGAVLALGGALLAIYFTHETLNVVSLMGMIMVVGIVAKNGILMLDAVEEHINNGDSLHEALLRSGRRRFRPVLMTSLAAILGMLPLALAIGAGAELLQPLAIAVIGGLIFALFFSLVVTPIVYATLRQK